MKYHPDAEAGLPKETLTFGNSVDLLKWWKSVICVATPYLVMLGESNLTVRLEIYDETV